jgi:hypothetical protein
MSSSEELEQYESDMELALYREYRDVLGMFRYAVETERRFYLANEVTVTRDDDAQIPAFELELTDAWVWDMYRPARFVSHVRVVTFHDVNVERIGARDDDDLPAYPPQSLAE